jgi:hypothetical protein
LARSISTAWPFLSVTRNINFQSSSCQLIWACHDWTLFSPSHHSLQGSKNISKRGVQWAILLGILSIWHWIIIVNDVQSSQVVSTKSHSTKTINFSLHLIYTNKLGEIYYNRSHTCVIFSSQYIKYHVQWNQELYYWCKYQLLCCHLLHTKIYYVPGSVLSSLS